MNNKTKGKKDRVEVIFRCDRKLAAQLVRLAKMTGESKSAFLRGLIRDYAKEM